MDVNNSFLKQIGVRLRKAREEQRLSQTELADAMEVRSNQYGKVENGKVAPSLKTLIKAAKALDISLDELVFGKKSTATKQDVISDKAMAERINVINELSGEDKMIAMHLFDLIVVKKKFKDMAKQIHTLHK